MNEFWLDPKNLLMLGVTGSHAYGFATPESDLDVRGVTMVPSRLLFGLNHFEQAEVKSLSLMHNGVARHSEDVVIYGLQKFTSLAADCNPNIVELLWLPTRHIISTNQLWLKFVSYRDLFLSKRVQHSFSGYAISQLKRLQTHYRWMKIQPPTEPRRADFGLPGHAELPAEAIQAMATLGRDKLSEVCLSRTVEYVMAEVAYHQASKEFTAYATWRKNRNPKRAALEEKMGYDGKHACHLLRLLTMGIEIMAGKGVIVDRTDAGDADYFKQVRNGLLSYDELMAESDRLENELKEVSKTSPLPYAVDRVKIDDLLCGLQQRCCRLCFAS